MYVHVPAYMTKRIRIHVTIDDKEIAWLDSQVKKGRFSSRDEGFDYCVSNAQKII